MALTAAKKAGVKVLYLPCNVKPDQLSIADVVMDQ